MTAMLLAGSCLGMAARAAEPAGPGVLKPPPSSAAGQMEAEVQTFLSHHHPELAQVLERLKFTLPHEYNRAVRDLSRVRQRLAQLAERDPQRHEADLQSWVIESHLQLAVARLAMNDSPALREEIRQLLHQQVELKLDMLRHERQRLAERLLKLDEQIERTDAQREQTIDKQFLSLTKSSENLAARARGASERPKRPSGESAGDRRQARP